MESGPFADETLAETKTRAAAALAGRIAEFSALDPTAEYRWLQVALDAGHEAAADRISDMREHIDLFHHDDGGARAVIELDVARLYLRGDVLPLNLEKGLAHLGAYLDVAPSLFLDCAPSELSSLVDEAAAEANAVGAETVSPTRFALSDGGGAGACTSATSSCDDTSIRATCR